MLESSKKNGPGGGGADDEVPGGDADQGHGAPPGILLVSFLSFIFFLFVRFHLYKFIF